MSVYGWVRAPRIRRSLAASAVVLAAGGSILYRASNESLAAGPERAVLFGDGTQSRGSAPMARWR
jgi:hypothetical protein